MAHLFNSMIFKVIKNFHQRQGSRTCCGERAFASGALAAFSAAGLRAPEDFRAATFSNAGFGPVYPRPLTRLEMDPRAHGAAAADLLLGFLAGRRIPAGAAIRSVYRRGETF